MRALQGTDAAMLCKIIDRAAVVYKQFNKRDISDDYRSDLLLALATQHGNEPLDLKRLLAADTSSFSHDVFGIHNHMGGDGKLVGCFLPRFTKREAT